MSGLSSGGGGGRNYGATRPYYDEPGGRGFGGYRDNASGRGPAAGSAGFNTLCDEISSNIFNINTSATTLERAIKQIGTNKDSIQLRDRLHDTEQNTNQVITQTALSLKELSRIPSGPGKTQKFQFDRLKNEFQDSIKRYNILQKRVAEALRATPKLAPKSAGPTGTADLIGWNDTSDDQAGLVRDEQRRQQLQAQQEVIESDLELIQEREERIRQLESDILDINEIFRDLGALVHEQGEIIGSIEDNVERTHDQVEAGRSELEKASEYQRKARKKKCFLIICLTIVVAVVVVIIVVSVKKS